MSVDQDTTQDLVKVAEDGKEGYAVGATELEESDRPDLVPVFTRLSEQRAGFSNELRALAATYGDTVENTGSAAAALHRGWMAIRDAVTGSGPESVLKTAVQGEDHAISAYEKALEKDIGTDTRTVAQRHLAALKAARAEVQALEQNTTK